MRESGYFPAGAEFDPSAPYNQLIPEDEREFDVLVSQTLSKSAKVYTNDYVSYIDEEDHIKREDTSDTNWKDAYADNDLHTPIQLIGLFKQFLSEQLSLGLVFKSPAYTKKLIEECEDWIEDECEIFRE